MLAVLYLGRTLIHLLDLLDIRLKFSQMGVISQSWTLYLFFADLVAAICLLTATRLGELIFVWIAIIEIAVYVNWSQYLGKHYGFLIFHLFSLGGYFIYHSLRTPPIESHP